MTSIFIILIIFLIISCITYKKKIRSFIILVMNCVIYNSKEKKADSLNPKLLQESNNKLNLKQNKKKIKKIKNKRNNLTLEPK